MCAVNGPPDQETHTEQQSINNKQPGAVTLKKLQQPVDSQPGHHCRQDSNQKAAARHQPSQPSILEFDNARNGDVEYLAEELDASSARPSSKRLSEMPSATIPVPQAPGPSPLPGHPDPKLPATVSAGPHPFCDRQQQAITTDTTAIEGTFEWRCLVSPSQNNLTPALR